MISTLRQPNTIMKWSLQTVVFIVGTVLICLNLTYFTYEDDNNNYASTRTATRQHHEPSRIIQPLSPTTTPARSPAVEEEPEVVITLLPGTTINGVETSSVDDATRSTPSSSVSTTNHINDQPYVPPAWVQSYIEFHKSQIQKSNNLTLSDSTRWLQWYCNYNDDGVRHCGGLADRIKGMMEALILAMVDQRVVLFEEWEGSSSTGQHPLTDYLQPNTIQWTLAPNATMVKKAKKFPTFVDAFGLSKSPAQRIVKTATCTFSIPKVVGVRFTGNLLTEEKILTAPGCYGKFGSDMGTVYSDLFWTLFRFSPAVHAEADRLRGARIIPQYRNYYVGVHVRTGNFSDDSGGTRVGRLRQSSVQALDQFAACIQAVATAIHAKCGGDSPPVTYLASDNADAKRYIHQKVGQSVPIQAPDVDMMHIDLHNNNHDDTLQDLNTGNDNKQQAGYRAVFGELKILMDSTCIITSDSGFSRLAKSLTRQRPRCAIAYDRCSNPDKVAKKIAMVPCPSL